MQGHKGRTSTIVYISQNKIWTLHVTLLMTFVLERKAIHVLILPADRDSTGRRHWVKVSRSKECMHVHGGIAENNMYKMVMLCALAFSFKHDYKLLDQIKKQKTYWWSSQSGSCYSQRQLIFASLARKTAHMGAKTWGQFQLPCMYASSSMEKEMQ